MHATYLFLINVDDPDDAEDEIAEAVKSTLSDWAEHNGDENNWYQEEAVVLKDGRAIGLCPKDDWRGRDGWIDVLNKKPQTERWQWSRLFALRCVATDMELGGRPSFSLPIPGAEKEPDPPYWNNFDALLDRILTEMPPRLAELWGKGPLLRPKDGADDNFSDRYHRGKWSQQFDKFLVSMAYGDNAPFSDSGTPYDYRAFDLTCGEEGNAILFVDIHT